MTDLVRSEPRDPIAMLPTHLADQIAAGEVVERPAAALKELVDNSIDAGATRVEVDLEAGGASRIRVIDNGIGIPPQQLSLALRRHATSKLRSADELLDVASLGFRGEALASIAAVARVSLRSRIRESATGFELISDPSDPDVARPQDPRPVGMPLGTQLDITDLFAAVPARRKFLRSTATETAHCSEVMLRIAQVHPDVELSLRHDGRALLHYPRQDLDTRVRQILQRRGVEQVHRYHADLNGVAFQAWLGEVPAAQASAALSIVVRRRVVVERALAKIVNSAFSSPPQPKSSTGHAASVRCAGVLMLEPGQGSVDVNVHPQKLEVRFSDPQRVYAALRQATSQWRAQLDAARADGEGRFGVAGSQTALAASLRARGEHIAGIAEQHRPDPDPVVPSRAQGYSLRTRATQVDYEAQRLSVRHQVDALAALSRRGEGRRIDPSERSSDDESSLQEDLTHGGHRVAGAQLPISLPDGSAVATTQEPTEWRWRSEDAVRLDSAASDHEGPALQRTPSSSAAPQALAAADGAVARAPVDEPVLIGALPGGVVLLLHEGALLAMDLACVRDELAFRRLADEVKNPTGVAIQRLIHPIVLHKSQPEVDLLARSSALLHPLGLDLEPFGAGSIALRGVPASLGWVADLQHVGTLVDRALAWLRLRESSRDPLNLLASLARSPTTADTRYAKRWLKEVIAHLRSADALQDGDRPVDLANFPGLHRWSPHDLIRRPGVQIATDQHAAQSATLHGIVEDTPLPTSAPEGERDDGVP